MGALREEIVRLIASEGPLSVERYMGLCLGHPRHGYYITRDPLGAGGDFTTAPEISQIFGELIGLWAAQVWMMMGMPPRLALIELGPGRGTLMADALRAARVVPAFRAAVSVHLVETSPVLRESQRHALAAAGVPVGWHDRLDDVPGGPAILIANEFFDALPIRQYVRGERGWHERLVGLGEEGDLVFGLAASPEPALKALASPGAVLETCPAGIAVAGEIGRRLGRFGGAALIIDYGHARTAAGETLQAVGRHAFVDPLAEPGAVDLTAHVDFEALARSAVAVGASAHGPAGQGPFLLSLGAAERAAVLKRKADEAGRAAMDAALARLTGTGAGAMGELFKVIGLSHPALAELPGLPRWQIPSDMSA